MDQWVLGAAIFGCGALFGWAIAKPIEVNNFGCCESCDGYDDSGNDDDCDFDEDEPIPYCPASTNGCR